MADGYKLFYKTPNTAQDPKSIPLIADGLSNDISVGSDSKPVYISKGEIRECSDLTYDGLPTGVYCGDPGYPVYVQGGNFYTCHSIVPEVYTSNHITPLYYGYDYYGNTGWCSTIEIPHVEGTDEEGDEYVEQTCGDIHTPIYMENSVLKPCEGGFVSATFSGNTLTMKFY